MIEYEGKPRKVFAVDPGTTESAWVELGVDGLPARYAKECNAAVLIHVSKLAFQDVDLVVEMVASYGMPVGAEVFETCTWIGRFEQAAVVPSKRLTRAQVKTALCHQTKGVNDSVLRQRVIDIYGGKDKAIGCKKTPGPLYGVKADVWQALALAWAWRSTQLWGDGHVFESDAYAVPEPVAVKP